jgi:hypothetical protein
VAVVAAQAVLKMVATVAAVAAERTIGVLLELELQDKDMQVVLLDNMTHLQAQVVEELEQQELLLLLLVKELMAVMVHLQA